MYACFLYTLIYRRNSRWFLVHTKNSSVFYLYNISLKEHRAITTILMQKENKQQQHWHRLGFYFHSIKCIRRNLAQILKQMEKLEEQIRLHWCPTQVSSNSSLMKWRLDSLGWVYSDIPRRRVAIVNWSLSYSEYVLVGYERFETEQGFVTNLTSFCHVSFVPAVIKS